MDSFPNAYSYGSSANYVGQRTSASVVSSQPSSRRMLTRALELARDAVQLDSRLDDPHGAIVGYGKSVCLLQEVMRRVMAGVDSTESRQRNEQRRRNVVAQEEEMRRLRALVGLSSLQCKRSCMFAYNVESSVIHMQTG